MLDHFYGPSIPFSMCTFKLSRCKQQEVLVTIQAAGHINPCMHGMKPMFRTAHATSPWALHWGRLMCTLPVGASPGERESWAHPELCDCLRSKLL